jgi:hypothetical protein
VLQNKEQQRDRVVFMQAVPGHAYLRNKSFPMQGLPDHAHVPTLERLPKDMHVVASPAGAKVAAGLGFTDITALDHGEEITIAGGKMKIRATAGASHCHHGTAREK